MSNLKNGLINNVSESEFKKIVEESTSLNEVALKIGFKHTPGMGSKNKIKDRIDSLNLKLKEKPSLKNIDREKNSQIPNKQVVGDVGEAYFPYDCFKHGLNVFKSISAGLPYDFLVEINGEFKKVQVKTAENIDPFGFIAFHTKRVTIDSASYKNKLYSTEDFDYFYLFCIENQEGYLVENKGSKHVIHIRINKPMNGQKKKIRYREDYLFSKKIKELKK